MRRMVVAKIIGLLLLGLYLVMGLAQPSGNNTNGGNSDGASRYQGGGYCHYPAKYTHKRTLVGFRIIITI